jgi:hypothetical protein
LNPEPSHPRVLLDPDVGDFAGGYPVPAQGRGAIARARAEFHDTDRLSFAHEVAEFFHREPKSVGMTAENPERIDAGAAILVVTREPTLPPSAAGTPFGLRRR